MEYSFVSDTVTRFGVNSDPLCEPSHHGWLLLCPQEHQKYFSPATNSTLIGAFPAILPLLIFYNISTR